MIFAACHTDVYRDRFRLLLSNFAFNEKALAPGLRGAVVGQAGDAGKPGTFLPYSVLYRALTRMAALNRLVVIDACQAEAIYDDRGVRLIEQKVDDAAHQARTAYLLAARKGEAAGESSALKHGVLTYLLLRGMGSKSLVPEPGGPLGNGDLNGDGVVSSDELREYVDSKMPLLVSRIELTGARANPNLPKGETPPTPPVRIQAASSSFPLLRLPAK